MVAAEHYAAIEAHAKREEVRGTYTLYISSRCHLQTDIPFSVHTLTPHSLVPTPYIPLVYLHPYQSYPTFPLA